MGGAYALDMGAVMTMGAAVEADMALLADVLPAVEQAILVSLDEDEPTG